MKKPKAEKSLDERAAEFAEAAIFEWYARCSEEHDMLSRDGLDALEASIKGAYIDEQTKGKR